MLIYQTLTQEEALKFIGRYVTYMRNGHCAGDYKLTDVLDNGNVELWCQVIEGWFEVPLGDIAIATTVEEA